MTFERFIIKWIWPYLKIDMERCQFGGQSKHSVTHYLVELYNMITHNMDMKTPLATMLLLVDYSKGFNRLDHMMIMKKLYGMGLPGWLLRLIADYLQNRTLQISSKV